MARDITTLPNTIAPDTDYPNGRVKDKVGANPGTRVNEAMLGDETQFFAKIMRMGGVSYNNLPDNEYVGNQFYEALLKVFGGLRRIDYELGGWDMVSDQSIFVSTDIPYSQVKGVTVMIMNDDESSKIFNQDIIIDGEDDGGDLRINLTRGTFYSIGTSFDDDSVNRGFIIIEYEPTTF